MKKEELINVDTIYVHPNTYQLIKELITEEKDKYHIKGNDFSTIYGIKVIQSEFIPEFNDLEYWERTDILPDNKFVKWITDMKNPPSWAIHFGLVRKVYKQVPGVWCVNNRKVHSVLKHGEFCP